MATLVYGMNQSLDGYVAAVDGTLVLPPPAPELFQHFVDQVRGQVGCLYGRRLYEVMRYWDEDQPDWDAGDRAFAAAWRALPKWVVSRTLKTLGPNATLINEDVEGKVRRLKAEVAGEIQVGGPELAHSLGALGLIDGYWLYFHPEVTGPGKPFFAGPRPPLRLTEVLRLGEVVRLSYAPA